MNEFKKIQSDPVSRRAFLQRMGAAGLGVAAVSMLNGCGGGGSGGSTARGDSYIDSLPGKNRTLRVLNYALTLEFLEADLYRQALNYACGFDLNDNGGQLRANSSSYTPAAGVANLGEFNTAAFAYLRDFAYVEASHRDYLISLIRIKGGTAVKANSKGYQFAATPPRDLRAILTTLLALEETGVRAYLGAIPYFSDYQNSDLTRDLAHKIVGIYSTEARHSAAIQYALGNDIGPNGNQVGVPSNTEVTIAGIGALPYSDKGLGDTFEYFSTPESVISAIQPLLVK